MARKVEISIRFPDANSPLWIRDYDTDTPNEANAFWVGGYGQLSCIFSNTEYIGNPSTCAFVDPYGNKIGGVFTFDNLQLNVDGLDGQIANYNDFNGLFNAIGSDIFATNAIPLPVGASTSAKQDALAALVGAGNGSVAASANGYLKVIADASVAILALLQNMATTLTSIEGNTASTTSAIQTLDATTSGQSTALDDIKTAVQSSDTHLTNLEGALSGGSDELRVTIIP